MPKRDNIARLADKYELSDLEPDVDPEKAAAFLASAVESKPKPIPKRVGTENSTSPSGPKRMAVTRSSSLGATTQPHIRNEDLWTSRTIRLRQSTATRLTKATYGQKVKQAEGKLKPEEPMTVQEIADFGVRLALSELGYDTS